MQQNLIVGVDVSKSTLDLYFQPTGMTLKISNDLAGFEKCLRAIVQSSVSDCKVLVVMEHTGHYSLRFEEFLFGKGIGYYKLAALQIKRSSGVVRGKTDRIDARRIADYAWLRRDLLKADTHLHKDLRDLRSLFSFRSKMVRDRAGYIARLKEMISSGVFSSDDFMTTNHKQVISALTNSIRQVEEKIKMLIESNPEFKKTSQLLQSIKGVGWRIAGYMVACTDNFRRFKNARKFNCYAGIAPFKVESGSSIALRARISHLANKEIKCLLNLGAASAARFDPELKQYYQRRISEGKRKMSCLNIIRSKLVSRMFAVVARQSPYEQRLVAA